MNQIEEGLVIGWDIAKGFFEKDHVCNLPTEVLRDIFVLAIKQSSLSHLEALEMLDNDTRQHRVASMRLSHVCARWRQILLNMPELWWISNDLRPDAVTEFITRTKESGLHVRIYDPAADRSVTVFLDTIQGYFKDIMVLNARLHTRKALHRILCLGRDAPMSKLRDIKLFLYFDDFSRLLEAEALNDQEREYGVELLDWQMPSIQVIHCRDVLPRVSRRISDMSMLASSRCNVRIPWSSAQDFLVPFTNISLPFYNGSIALSAPSGSASQVIPVPNLKRLSTIIRTDCASSSLQHPFTLNRLRFGALTTLVIRLNAEFEAVDPTAHMRAALSSMTCLRTLEILETLGSLDAFLDEALFPQLETCLIRWVALNPPLSTGTDTHRFRWSSIPLSLKEITFESCKRDSAYGAIIPALLRALHQRFGEDTDRGKLAITHTEGPTTYLDEAIRNLDEETTRRLTVLHGPQFSFS